MPRPKSIHSCPDCNFRSRGPYAVNALRLHRMRKIKAGLHPHRPIIDGHISKPSIGPRGHEQSFTAQASSEPTEYTQTELARELNLKSNSDLAWHGKKGRIPKGHRRGMKRYYTASEAQTIRDFYATKPPRIRSKLSYSQAAPKAAKARWSARRTLQSELDQWSGKTDAIANQRHLNERSPNVNTAPDSAASDPRISAAEASTLEAQRKGEAAVEAQLRAEEAAEVRFRNHCSYLYGYLSRSIEDYARSSGLSESSLTQALAGLLQGRKVR